MRNNVKFIRIDRLQFPVSFFLTRLIWITLLNHSLKPAPYRHWSRHLGPVRPVWRRHQCRGEYGASGRDARDVHVALEDENGDCRHADLWWGHFCHYGVEWQATNGEYTWPSRLASVIYRSLFQFGDELTTIKVNFKMADDLKLDC